MWLIVVIYCVIVYCVVIYCVGVDCVVVGCLLFFAEESGHGLDFFLLARDSCEGVWVEGVGGVSDDRTDAFLEYAVEVLLGVLHLLIYIHTNNANLYSYKQC